ncbi:DUF255 domain-containing protein [Litorilituus lipolyticus]|uniref:DUF255 domain-containing protein n=1 Tax=Litorilituus lipolyticus TaxID=2491017 RepID=A0A502L2K0_9GAMM|nr:DUF255 domain-containing protein [Litorilituus lipolyticus]TPH17059.1 DUF255 domain-containing protein [Litorilituus lipolyticus]
MHFLILVIVIYCTPLFSANSADNVYKPPVGVEVGEAEFARWQQEFLKQAQNISHLAQYSDKSSSSVTYINRLVFGASPYLLRHAVNPVNWYSWHEDALATAKKENKLLFLSIGYSTCHWCHVMEKESFTSLEIAKALNSDYISIKLDRELTPSVDQYFTQALELATGSAGWPINAVLTPNGDVVWIDSYLSPDKFSKTIKRLAKVWQVKPQVISQVAKNFSSQLKTTDASSEVSWSIDKSISIVKGLINNIDPVHGGLKGDRKFPSATIVQLLMYQYQLNPNDTVKSHIKHFLDKLTTQGIRDHLHGGFYRYSVDTLWQQPHFEKMLYNQALLISTFSKAYQLFNDESYKQVVFDTISFVNQWLRSSDGRFYSAIDADYQGKEGLYYLFTNQELASVKEIYKESFVWCSFNLTELSFPCSTSKLTNNNRAKQALLTKKSQLAKPHIDKKFITAWNALMVSALIDAYSAFDDVTLLSQAKKLAEVLVEEHMYGIGKLTRINYLGKASGDAVLSDYAYLGYAMFQLYQDTKLDKWYQLAVQFYQKGSELFGKNYRGNELVESNLLDDGEMISGHAVLMSLGLKLRAYGENNSDTLKPQMLKLKQAVMNSSGSHFAIHELFLKNEFGVFDSKQYFAQGKGVVKLIKLANKVTLYIQLDDGWHINSNMPLEKYLIPTKVSSVNGSISQLRYPEAKIKKLGFSKTQLSLFDGDFQISANIHGKSSLGEKVELKLQACSDKLCLLPEKLSFYLPTK